MANDQKDFTQQWRGGMNTESPSIARAYDAFLGGKDHFEVDAAVFRAAQEVVPEAALLATENRKWQVRVIRFLTSEAGIDQFLDCGSGLPTQENTHQVAQRLNPDAVVVYVDNDPAVRAFGLSNLTENENTHFIEADFTQVSELLAHPTVTENLDFTRPIGLIHGGTLHHVPNEIDPYGVIQSYIAALPSGSYVAITHFFDPEDESGHLTSKARGIEQAFRDNNYPTGYFRTRDKIASFFDGTELVEPGLSLLKEWWPEGPKLKPAVDADYLKLTGVGRKP